METILFVVTISALIGAYLNSVGRREGFLIWIITNAIFAFNNWMIGQWQQSLLFSAYLVIAVNGLIHSKPNESVK